MMDENACNFRAEHDIHKKMRKKERKRKEKCERLQALASKI